VRYHSRPGSNTGDPVEIESEATLTDEYAPNISRSRSRLPRIVYALLSSCKSG
ncbi:unnamed protein product, partial [Mycena citricolor]